MYDIWTFLGLLQLLEEHVQRNDPEAEAYQFISYKVDPSLKLLNVTRLSLSTPIWSNSEWSKQRQHNFKKGTDVNGY